MATVHDKTKPAPAARYDAVVEGQLARARGRIRSLDAAVGVLGFVAGTLAYGAVMTLVDRWLLLAPLTRQLIFAGYLVAAAVYLGFALVLPLCRRLNPYYAAREVERSIPGAKNSVVNWLDLHDQPLPAAIHGAVSQRAARDVAQVNLEQAISGRRAAWLGGAVAGLGLLLFVLMLLLGARPFFSLLGRAFVPFREGVIATQTQITLLRPEGGDVTVPVDQSVAFAVDVDGRVPEPGQPDALKLRFRYQQSDPWEERPLERESGREWVVTIPAYEVHNGFWYKITGGDDATPVHHVGVRSIPLLTGFEVLYHYRPYLRYPDLTTKDPNLRAHRGTEVTLTAHTNRAVQIKASRLEVEQKGGPKKVVLAEAVEGDPQALRFKFVLEADGSYRILFTSTDGEASNDLLPYRIQTLKDEKPEVKLTKPGQDGSLPANGMLQLEGEATDDIGLVGLTLRMKVVNGETLAAKPYREGKDFKLAEGGYPRLLGYKDFVELAKLKDAAGKPFAVRPKMVLEYWLEAVDNCDFPKANVGASKHYKVTVTEPVAQDKQKQQQQEQQAAQDKKEHEQQQDQQLQKEGEERQKNPDQPPQAEKDQNPQPDGGKGQKPEDAKGGDGNPQDKPQANPDPKQDEADKKREQEIKDLVDKLQKEQQNGPGARDKPDPQPEPNGDDKGQQQPPQDDKPKDGDKGGQGPQQGKPDAGNEKGGQNQGDGGQNAGQPKNDGNEQGQPKPQPGQEKQQGQGNMGGDKSGDKGGGQPQQGAGAGDAKDKDGQGGQKGGGKDARPGDLSRINEGGAGGGKDRGRGFDKDQDGGGGDATKDDPRRLHRRGEDKGEGKDNSGQGEPKGAGKQGGDRGQQGGQAGQKSAAPKDQGEGGNKAGEAKAENGKGQGDTDKVDPKEAKKEDVDRMAKKAKGGKNRQDRDKAEKKLDDMAKQAADPEVRKAARQAREEVERLQRENEQQGAAAQVKKEPANQNDPMNNGGEPCAQCKNPGNKPGGAGAPKNAGGKGTDGDKDGAQGAGQPKPDKGEGENGLAKGPGLGEEQGAEPGGGGKGGAESNSDAEKAEGERNAEHLKKAADLLLREFRKTVEKDGVKGARPSNEELERYVRENWEWALRQAKQPKQAEKLAAPKHGGALPTARAHEATRGTGKVDDVKAAGRGTAPPGYRDSSRDFSKAINGDDKAPENK